MLERFDQIIEQFHYVDIREDGFFETYRDFKNKKWVSDFTLTPIRDLTNEESVDENNSIR